MTDARDPARDAGDSADPAPPVGDRSGRRGSTGGTPVGRRCLLSGLAAGLGAGLAGCTGDGPAGGTTAGDSRTTAGDSRATTADARTTTGDRRTTTGDPGTTAGGPGTTAGDPRTTTEDPGTTADGDLDLREANVTAVEFGRSGDRYRFSVTLYHDDDGEDGYANWWQVETLDGERIGRRDLLHAHGTREFTRSETVAIPEGVTRVVVRGHDRTHGYGGQAALVDLETGTVELVRQGPEPADLSDRG